jgi:hypothetical protein
LPASGSNETLVKITPMHKKQILTLLLIAFCTIAIAQAELILKFHTIAKSGLEKGIPGMQVLISDRERIHN